MWIEGSYATSKNNSRSDIDVWLDVDDGSFDLCLADFRRKLQELVEIEKETTRGVYSDSPKLMKQTFILKGSPKAKILSSTCKNTAAALNSPEKNIQSGSSLIKTKRSNGMTSSQKRQTGN